MRMSNALTLICLLTTNAFAQDNVGEQAMKIQQEKLKVLTKMDGIWRGKAWYIAPDQKRYDLTQTERVGPLLDGSIKLVEGIGVDNEGNKQFNAFGVITYDTTNSKYVMRSYTKGRIGDFNLEVTKDGFKWSIPAGPFKIRYTAQIKESEWIEYGERIVKGHEPVKIFEMKLKRLGNSSWPASESRKTKLGK